MRTIRQSRSSTAASTSQPHHQHTCYVSRAEAPSHAHLQAQTPLHPCCSTSTVAWKTCWAPLPSRTPATAGIACKAGPAQAVTSGPAIKADLTLVCQETGTTIHVFAVEHLAPQPHIGRFILENRPSAVVVETAMGPEHGAVPGNVITAKDQVMDPSVSFFLRMFAQVGATLQEMKDPTESDLWRQISTSYNGEQLAYVGAFATGAPLVFGDRPKDITYRRLAALATIPQLDAAFTYQSVANYRDTLQLPAPAYEVDGLPMVEEILMQEREAVMLQVVHQLCHNRLPQVPLPGQPPSLVLVLGSSHLPGVECLWNSQRWQQLVGWCDLPASVLMSAPQLPNPNAADYGLRRGMLEALLRLSVTQEVIQDVTNVLGPVPPEHRTAYTAVGEIYGAMRMQLASLPQDMLQAATSSYECDFHQVLQSMRDVRPINGGPGYSDEMVMFVRSLNFELD